MKLLIIGGSYFYGRVFVMQAAGKHEITVVNRGTYSMAASGVKEIRGDRRDENLWKTIREDYDVIVDFCAYEKGDIARVLENIEGKVKQYIFISTVDVYERGMQGRKTATISEGKAGSREEAEMPVLGGAAAEEKMPVLGGTATEERMPVLGGAATEEKMPVLSEAAEEEMPRPGGAADEESPFENRLLPGEAGRYIAGKVALEQEVREECGRRGIHYTVLRPAILYGPFNYAPRESVYIQMIVRNRILPHITGADGAFQMVYVKDAAEAILKCLLNERTYGQAYNLCQDQLVNYDSFYRELSKAADGEPMELPVTAGEAMSKGIPLPFPVTEEETELYSNEKSKRELGMAYLDFSEGMARTYRAFRGVFGDAG